MYVKDFYQTSKFKGGWHSFRAVRTSRTTKHYPEKLRVDILKRKLKPAQPFSFMTKSNSYCRRRICSASLEFFNVADAQWVSVSGVRAFVFFFLLRRIHLFCRTSIYSVKMLEALMRAINSHLKWINNNKITHSRIQCENARSHHENKFQCVVKCAEQA